MTHPDADTLDALAYGMLEPPAVDEVRAHVAGCADCRSALARIESEAAGLQAALRVTPTRPLPVLWIVAAASVLLAVLSFLLSTPRQEPMLLADGTTVEAHGSVTVKGPREVRVGRGTYLFNVAEAAETFLIRTPTAEIEVLGTTFFVEVKEEEMTRSEALVTLVAVAAGAVAIGNYFGWIDLGPAEEGVAPENGAPHVVLEPDPRVHELRADLARLEAEKEALLRRAESEIHQPAIKEARVRHPEPPSPPVVEEVEIPDAVAEAAKQIVVSEGALKVALNLDILFRKDPHGEDPELLSVLRAYGEDGFRAVLALLHGGRNGIWFKRMIGATWSPGLESRMIDLVEDPEVHIYSKWSALSSLSVADTPLSRDYLVRRLSTEMEPGLYMCTAGALGELHESRGASWLDDRITGEGWGGVRGQILVAAGEMGGQDAARFLTAYVRKPRADQLGAAFQSLDKLDHAAAAGEARALMSGDRWRFIDQMTRKVIERIGGE